MTDYNELEDLRNLRMNNFENKMALTYVDAFEKLKAAEIRLAEIKKDIENFFEIAESYSRFDVARELHRYELDISNAKRAARNTRKKASLEHPTLCPNEIDELYVVRAAYAKRDAKIKELKPKIAFLKCRLYKCEQILKKYA
mgnify:CR=1 FL=1|jgi:hypothetical protein